MEVRCCAGSSAQSSHHRSAARSDCCIRAVARAGPDSLVERAGTRDADAGAERRQSQGAAPAGHHRVGRPNLSEGARRRMHRPLRAVWALRRLTGYTPFHDFSKLPDKDRTEYAKKGNIIDVYNGNQGWSMDRGGVQEASASAIEDYQAGLKKDVDQLLRFRLNEEGMNFRYGGSDI